MPWQEPGRAADNHTYRLAPTEAAIILKLSAKTKLYFKNSRTTLRIACWFALLALKY